MSSRLQWTVPKVSKCHVLPTHDSPSSTNVERSTSTAWADWSDWPGSGANMHAPIFKRNSGHVRILKRLGEICPTFSVSQGRGLSHHRRKSLKVQGIHPHAGMLICKSSAARRRFNPFCFVTSDKTERHRGQIGQFLARAATPVLTPCGQEGLSDF